VVLVNMRNETIPDTSFQEIQDNIASYLDKVTAWPATDLFVDYRIKNRWLTTTATYLDIYDQNGKVEYGKTNHGDYMRWQLQPTSDGYYRIMNRATGDVISIEHLYPWAEYLPNNSSWWSTQWTKQNVDSGSGCCYVRFLNRWNGDGLHVENQTGYAQHGPLQTDWLSMQWLLEAVP
jgi:hypothetical protein